MKNSNASCLCSLFEYSVAAKVLKPCSDLDVFPLTISKGDILLPAAFTQAMTVMLVRQDDVRPTTVLEPFSAIIRTG